MVDLRNLTTLLPGTNGTYTVGNPTRLYGMLSTRKTLQGVAGNKKGEFEAEAQFLSKLHTNNG
jgi:hypothetical protein